MQCFILNVEGLFKIIIAYVPEVFDQKKLEYAFVQTKDMDDCVRREFVEVSKSVRVYGDSNPDSAA